MSDNNSKIKKININNTTLTYFTLETINQAAQDFIEQIGTSTVFAFNGNMGAGKTTFIKAICETLGVEDTINSPTFSIVNEYEAADGRIIYHFDCYRINNIEEANEIGVEDYLYSGNLCFIEWSDNIASLLPDTLITLEIEELDNGERRVMIK